MRVVFVIVMADLQVWRQSAARSRWASAHASWKLHRIDPNTLAVDCSEEEFRTKEDLLYQVLHHWGWISKCKDRSASDLGVGS